MNKELTSIGSRMAVARHIIGKTTAQMAVSVGVGTSVYGKFESGNANSLPYLNAIADGLCVSSDFLLTGPIGLIPATSLSFRKRLSLKSPEVRHVQGMASLAGELTNLIEEFVTLPPVSVPFTPPVSIDDIEEVTRPIRIHLQMSDAPLKDAIALVESYGVLVFWVEAAREFDGVSFWHRDRPYILLNKSQKDGYRARFTVMHELGHLICHRSDADKDRHEEGRKLRDKEADRFASAFLMPASSFARRFPRRGTIYDILDDRSYWKVSCAAMVHRARQLHLIDEDHYRRLNISISAKGWRRGEPNSPLPETSRVHRFFLDEAGEFGLTTGRLAEKLSYEIGWIKESFAEADQYQMEFSLGPP